MDIEIRPIGLDHLEEAMRMLAASFGEDLQQQDLEDERPVFAAGLNLAAFEGDTIVGNASAYPMELTVPGGVLPAAGITSVGVLPTHRRRGIARTLMRSQIDELHQAGTPLAHLWASENVIYQRFGYGLGSYAAAFEIRREDTAFLLPFRARGRTRLIDRAEALKLIPTLYEAVRPTRPGMPNRDEHWSEIRFRDTEHSRGGASALFFVVYESKEGLEGHVAYRVKEAWDHRTGPGHTLLVEELMAATVDAYGALWRYCFEVDLVRSIEGWKRPVDEPLLHMLANPRGLGMRVRDGTWLRLVDVRSAMEGRTYGERGRLVLDVHDGFCPWNEGRWELDGSPNGASCRSTHTEPDLVLGAGELASMYLGTIRPSALARAGRIEERTDGALRLADTMFASDLAPWCPYIF
ncbi:MAG: GNAT family N-acetyltransferase [Actinomycetota bacterium]